MELKILRIVEFIKSVFPYASTEIVTVAVVCFLMTLFGISLGLILLKIK